MPRVIQKYSTRAGSPEDPFYWELTLDFGRRHARMVIEWCDQALKKLEKTKEKKRK